MPLKMPPGPLDPAMFAPCGMDCTVCYRHCAHKAPCAGCLKSDEGKPEHCRACGIKDCAREKGLSYCHECPAWPCARIKRLDKSYRTRYGASLVENGRRAGREGLAAFMAHQKQAYACPACGGVVSLHDGACSECGRKTE